MVVWCFRKEPISHWLMLWSSSEIREAKTEIGSAQPRWSKKLGGLRYTGWIRLGRSITVHVFQLHFLVDYLSLGGRRRFYAEGFGFLFDNTSLSCPCVCISSAVDVILIGSDCLPILFLACVHFPHTYCLS